MQVQVHEGGMERTARRFLDSMARNKTLKSLVMSEGQQKGLVPTHLLSIGDSAWQFNRIMTWVHFGSPGRDTASYM
jgi:hypothetical protein